MNDFIDKVKEVTGFDEDVIGCCINNFGNPKVCEASRSAGCKSLKKCIKINNTIKAMEGERNERRRSI